MSKFDRKVARQKNQFQFTKKENEKELSRLDECKENFSFSWIPRKWSSFMIIILNFLFVTVVFIPLLMNYYNRNVAVFLGHSIMTAVLIVITFYILADKKDKPKLSIVCIRYCFMAMLLGVFSLVAILVV